MGDFPRKVNGLKRSEIERSEGWRDAIELAPKLSFPRSWQVQIVPPFSGALMRFVAHKGGAMVSVYADYNEALGYFGEPYWEIHPGPSGDCERFALHETDEMLSNVSKSLAKQRAGTMP